MLSRFTLSGCCAVSGSSYHLLWGGHISLWQHWKILLGVLSCSLVGSPCLNEINNHALHVPLNSSILLFVLAGMPGKQSILLLRDTWKLLKVASLASWPSTWHNNSSHSAGLQPKKYETFIAVRALSRFVECHLLLWWASSNKSMHQHGARKVRIKCMRL